MKCLVKITHGLGRGEIGFTQGLFGQEITPNGRIFVHLKTRTITKLQRDIVELTDAEKILLGE